ncbi:MAG: general secretion pathway protein GspK [Pelagibaca sp.]
MTRRDDQSGVVLVNVLVVLAIAGGLLMLLVNTQDSSIARVSRRADASLLEQIALGAEASVIDALRRDLDNAPDVDHMNEAWALGVIQNEVQLPTGTFSVKITDLQSKFNINQLSTITAGTQEFARRLMSALDQPPETADQIGRILNAIGPVKDLEALKAFGISEQAILALEPFVTALPIEGTVNLNTVDPFLLGVMMQNDSQANQLLRIRERQGSLSLETFRSIGALRPQNSGFTSNAYLADILAEAGVARLRMRTMIVRQNDRGIKSVDILERRFVDGLPDAGDT